MYITTKKKSLALCRNFSFCSFQHTIEGRNVTQLPSTTRYLLTVIPALSMRTITLVMTLLINNSYHLTLVYDEIYNKNFKIHLFIFLRHSLLLSLLLLLVRWSFVCSTHLVRYFRVNFGQNNEHKIYRLNESLINLTFDGQHITQI